MITIPKGADAMSFLQNSEAKYVIIGTRRHRDKS
jgi:hypothetical protein